MVVSKPDAGPEKMVQFLFPSLHECLIILRCELGYKLIARRAEAGVHVGDVGNASFPVWSKLNGQSTGCRPGRNLQHLSKQLLRLVTRDRATSTCTTAAERGINEVGHAQYAVRVKRARQPRNPVRQRCGEIVVFLGITAAFAGCKTLAHYLE